RPPPPQRRELRAVRRRPPDARGGRFRSDVTRAATGRTDHDRENPSMSITPRTRRWIRHGAAVAAAAGALALAPTVSASASTRPVPTACQPTVVRSAELVRTVYGPAIQVTGVAPGPNVDLRLVPEDIV